jgi:hypothetical protein
MNTQSYIEVNETKKQVNIFGDKFVEDLLSKNKQPSIEESYKEWKNSSPLEGLNKKEKLKVVQKFELLSFILLNQLIIGNPHCENHFEIVKLCCLSDYDIKDMYKVIGLIDSKMTNKIKESCDVNITFCKKISTEIIDRNM